MPLKMKYLYINLLVCPLQLDPYVLLKLICPSARDCSNSIIDKT